MSAAVEIRYILFRNLNTTIVCARDPKEIKDKVFLLQLCWNTLNDRSVVIYHSVIELALIAILFVVLACYYLENSPNSSTVQYTMISHTLGEFIWALSLILGVFIFIIKPVALITSLGWPRCVRNAVHPWWFTSVGT